MRLLAELVIALCATTITSANAASFDCAKASSQIEHAICSSDRVSKLDGELGALYSRLLDYNHGDAAFKDGQRQWVKSNRNQCGDEACLVGVYENRVSAFRTASEKLGIKIDDIPSNVQEEKPPANTPEDNTPTTATQVTLPTAQVDSAAMPEIAAPTTATPPEGQKVTAQSPQPTPAAQIAPPSVPPAEKSNDQLKTLLSGAYSLLLLAFAGGVWYWYKKMAGKVTKRTAWIVGIVGLGVLGSIGKGLGLTEDGSHDSHVGRGAKDSDRAIVAPIVPQLNGIALGDRPQNLPSAFQPAPHFDTSGMPSMDCYQLTGDMPVVGDRPVDLLKACFVNEKLTAIIIASRAAVYGTFIDKVKAVTGQDGTKRYQSETLEWMRKRGSVKSVIAIDLLGNKTIYTERIAEVDEGEAEISRPEIRANSPQALETDPYKELLDAYVGFDDRCKATYGEATFALLNQIDSIRKLGGSPSQGIGSVKGQLMMLRSGRCTN